MDTVAPGANPETPDRERADVARWHKRIKEARDFDEMAREQYARDRRQARGDSGFEVDANVLGTYIDISESFLYARNPDVDVLPSRAVEPPDASEVMDAILAVVPPTPPPQPALLGMIAGPVDPMVQQAIVQQQAQAEHARIMERFRKRQRDAKHFAETLEIVVSQLWRDARLKTRARKSVRSALTTGCGWLKASWQERTAPSAETLQTINDLQDNLKRLRALQVDAKEASGDELETKAVDIERQIAALQAEVETVIARGFVIDFVRSDDMQVAPGVDLSDFQDSPWMAHRIPMLVDEAKAAFGLDDEALRSATRFYARKPEMIQRDSPMLSENITQTDADAFVSSSSINGETGRGVEYVMCWEIWDRDSNAVLTTLEGCKRWVKPPWAPCATTRFYPFFLFAMNDVDGQRHPQSLVSRSAKLVDEYNRIGTAEAEHRRRIKPKTAFNAGGLDPEEARKLEGATTQEMVPIRPTNPMQPIGELLMPVAYAPLDAALYSRDRIIGELERIWGIQEALAGAVETAKTATEAEIQQTGFNARSTSRRDLIEEELSDLARYTAEVAWHYMQSEDVIRIAGPDAFWPQYVGPESLKQFVSVEIRAGTTGKPNTKAERESWSMLLPMLQQGITTIAQLRSTPPADVADCFERLLRMTAERSGERMDMDSLIPKLGTVLPQLGPPGAPNGPAGPEQDPAAGGSPLPGQPDAGADPLGAVA